MNQVFLACVPSPKADDICRFGENTLRVGTSTGADAVNRSLSTLSKWAGGDAFPARHFMFSFIFVSSQKTLMTSVGNTDLAHILSERQDGFYSAYVSGTLSAWETAIVRCTQKSHDFALRNLYTKVYNDLRHHLPPLHIQKTKDGTLCITATN